MNGRSRLAFDAKYKVEGAADNPNRFQMLAYCTALGITTGWLVYAEGDGTAAERRVRNSDISLIEYPLDPTTDPADLLAQVHRLADLAWNQPTAPATTQGLGRP